MAWQHMQEHTEEHPINVVKRKAVTASVELVADKAGDVMLQAISEPETSKAQADSMAKEAQVPSAVDGQAQLVVADAKDVHSAATALGVQDKRLTEMQTRRMPTDIKERVSRIAELHGSCATMALERLQRQLGSDDEAISPAQAAVVSGICTDKLLASLKHGSPEAEPQWGAELPD